MLKYPFPGKGTRANDEKRARLECPGFAVSHCRAAVEGEGEMFPTALRWVSACGWQRDTGTESLLDSSVRRRKERRNRFRENPLSTFLHFHNVPTYKEKHGLYNNEIPETLPPHRRPPIQSEQSLLP